MIKISNKFLIVLLAGAITACQSSDETSSESDADITTNAQPEQVVEEVQPEVVTDVVEEPVDVQEDMQQVEDDKNAALRRIRTFYFDFNTSSIPENFYDVLDAHAAYLTVNPTAQITVEGHTDERGTPEYNIALGERRAKAVARYLEALGVEESQINIVSFGEMKPAVAGRTKEAYNQNRRAVIVDR